MPSHADGSTSEIATVVRSFIGELGRFDLPIEAVDERYSSVEVRLKAQRTEGLRGRIRKEMIDAAAAVLIAERWLKNEHQ